MFVGSRLLSGAVAIGLVPVLMALGITQSVLGGSWFHRQIFGGVRRVGPDLLSQ